MDTQGIQRGFTLIELMIVVAIIAILAAIAMPAYQAYVIRAQVSEGSSLAEGAKVAMLEYRSENPTWPAANIDAGLSNAGDIHGKYVDSVDIGNPAGQITVTFGGQAHPDIGGRTLVFSATSNAGSIDWACRGKGTIDGKYLPSACRG